jgi:hypothetical protein
MAQGCRGDHEIEVTDRFSLLAQRASKLAKALADLLKAKTKTSERNFPSIAWLRLA